MTTHDETQDTGQAKQMSLSLALLPVVVLIAALCWNVIYVYGDDALSGSSQMIILLVAGLAASIGLARGVSWETQQKQVITTIGAAMPSILILLLVGALASIWLLSGTVPLLVYYGVKLLNPTIFLPACVVACAFDGRRWPRARNTRRHDWRRDYFRLLFW